MNSWSDGVLTVILDRSVEELIGAILLALTLSAAFAALGVWVCRSRRDETTRLTVVMLVLSLVSMTISGVFVQRAYDPVQATTGLVDERAPGPPPGFPYPPRFRASSLLDDDGDGHVSREEFNRAAIALGKEDRTWEMGPPGPGWEGFGRDGSPDGESPGPDGPGMSDPPWSGRLDGSAQELQNPPAEDGGDPPTSIPAGLPIESTEEHP